MNLWSGIDPQEGQARLRGVNRRLAELDEALKSAQALAAQNPESRAVRLSISGLLQIQERLQAERVHLVKHRERERLSIALNGTAFDDHTASIGALGAFLFRLQGLCNSIAQALVTGPKLRGPISADITRAVNMRFAEVFPSSFGMQIYVSSSYDANGESVAISTLQSLFNLLNSTKREVEISRLSAELGQRALNHLRHVLRDLDREHAGFSLDWEDGGGVRYEWHARSSDIVDLRQNVSRYSERYNEEVVLRGYLAGASLLRDRFEFFREDRSTIEGRLTKSVKPKLREYFGRRCIVRLDKVEILEKVSGDIKTYHTMTDILPYEPLE